ncbi:hypothetical protein HF086_004937 [Spodoptera exigua]|uniref:Uncharacterized protein n=1 Tax=Spodoptera exigua TaxID=7107 RepID=A0A922MU60_SPOEX|nr:hypothetical protein HF086_004937 [Spodoptera exigua]
MLSLVKAICVISPFKFADLANTDSAMLGGEGMGSLQTEQRSLEIQEYRRNYFSIVVAAILARARRESDDTDDITEAAARCHISDQPITAPGPNHPNPFNS